MSSPRHSADGRRQITLSGVITSGAMMKPTAAMVAANSATLSVVGKGRGLRGLGRSSASIRRGYSVSVTGEDMTYSFRGNRPVKRLAGALSIARRRVGPKMSSSWSVVQSAAALSSRRCDSAVVGSASR